MQIDLEHVKAEPPEVKLGTVDANFNEAADEMKLVKNEETQSLLVPVPEPTHPSVWGHMPVIARGKNQFGNEYCKHYLEAGTFVDVYHYKNTDGSIYFMNPDKSEYYHNPTGNYSRYLFPSVDVKEGYHRAIRENWSPNVHQEREKLCFVCTEL